MYKGVRGAAASPATSYTIASRSHTLLPAPQSIVPFIVSVRDLIAGFPSTSPPPPLLSLELHLFGGYTTTYDVQSALFKVVPVVIGVTIAIVLTMVGASFGSVSLAARLVLTTGVSLAWTYGLLVLVYQPGPAQEAFKAVSPTLRASSSVYWIIPVMSFR